MPTIHGLPTQSGGLNGDESVPVQTASGLTIQTTTRAIADLAGIVDLSAGVTGLLPVIHGGTGLATLTANNVILGNATGTPTFVAPGTTGNVLTSNGTTWASTPPDAVEPVLIQVACSDETTALTTGVAKVTFRAPYAFTLTAVRASVTTAPTGGTLLTVDVNESGTSVISTKLTFDASEKTTVTAATPPVISDSAIADDAEITVDIDAVGSTIAGAGLKVTLIGTKP